MFDDKPISCIDPEMKYCQGCPYGWVRYPDWVETREDLCDCFFESGCTLGFDNISPVYNPTEND